ncbi:MAG: MMPL family transporter [Oscillospiraceae bacterium]|jgi:predicted RND superfamily exporter protein|nr:MMPL family transporter [Oscillospiraceae bacterium]
MQKLAGFIVNRRYIVLGVMLFVIIACGIAMPRVNINSDMTKYLPDDSSMKVGLDVMTEEFPDAETTQTVRVMFDNLGPDEKGSVKSALEAIRYVDSVDYDAASEDYNRENHTLYVIHTAYDYGSDEEKAIETAVKDRFSGYAMTLKNDDEGLTDIISVWIVALAFAIMMIVLFTMCASWAEPFLFLLAIGCAIVMNMGSNIFLGEVSNITSSIAAILQMVLSMDYSIILMNRYRQELKTADDKTEAMKRALKNAFSSIMSSAFTTIVGLLALVFMRFKIGFDMGFVLAKGVALSLFCIFTVLPGLILFFDKAIRKTAKKELHIPTKGLASASRRFRGVFTAGFILLFVVSFIIQGYTGTAFTLERKDPIAGIFTPVNTIVLVYGNTDDNAVTAIAETLEADPRVKSAASYSTTIGKAYAAGELAGFIDGMGIEAELDATLLNILYYDYFNNGETPAVTAGDFINFIADDVITNRTFSDYMDSGIQDSIDGMKKFADKNALTAPMNADDLSAFLGIDADAVRQLLYYYSMLNGDSGALSVQTFVDFIAGDILSDDSFRDSFDADSAKALKSAKTLVDAVVSGKAYSANEMSDLLSGLSDRMDANTIGLMFLYRASLRDSDPDWTLSMETLFDYLSDEVANDPRFSSMLGDGFREDISDYKANLEDGIAQLKGDRVSRLILSTTLPGESEETSLFFKNLTADLSDNLTGEYYLIGNSAMNYEMENSFGREMLVISLLTAISIFIVVLLTFRNFAVPIILVLIVQCGVYITGMVIGLQGFSIYYLALLVVQSILMGATIDYGILFTNYYREKRKTMNSMDALKAAYEGSIHTILTSGLIMILVTGIMGYLFEDPIIGQICRTISIGTLAASSLILFVLPGLLATFDRIVVKKE